MAALLQAGMLTRWLQDHYFGHFPGYSVVKNPPSNAGDMGSVPGQGTKITHAVEQQPRRSPRALTTEPVLSRAEDKRSLRAADPGWPRNKIKEGKRSPLL